jgi:NADH:ubiquinone reductase (H+-translocating)
MNGSIIEHCGMLKKNETHTMAKTKVIILGGGFAGLNAAKILGKTALDVWLIDKNNHHLFQPLLYEVATAALSPADIAVPIREILARHQNITVVMGEVISIDKEKRLVSLKNGECIGFDYLIIALGSRTAYYGHEDWEPFAPGLKNLMDAQKIREQILISFEKAERCSNRSQAAEYLNFVIIGGGPRGAEMAGAIAEVAYQAMARNFRHIDPAHANIFLIERLPRILSSFPESLSKKARTYLESMHVRVMTDASVVAIDGKGVTVNETRIAAPNIFWLAGDQGLSVFKTLGVLCDRQGRVIVDPDLSISGHPEIFVIGDAASATDQRGTPLPAMASVAIQQGRYVGRIIARRLEKKDRPPFHYFDKGMLTVIGKTKGIGSFKNFQFSGFFAWTVWGLVHLFYLMGFRNRLSVFLEWIFSFFTNKRYDRVIYRSIDDR